MRHVRILITNDDGVAREGIHALARAVAEAGHDVVVAAPQDERSGSGAAVGHLADGVTVDIVEHPIGVVGVPAYGVDGPPGLCVLLGMLEAFGPRPDIVLSGINYGTNTGRGVLQSGTVGAVLTAVNFGLSGMAVSQHVDGGHQHWTTAQHMAVFVLDWLAAQPPKTAVNVNVPNVDVHDLKGVRWGRLAAFGSTSTRVEGAVPGRLTIRVTPREVALKPDTDTALVDRGYVSVTTLVPPRATDPVEVAAALEDALTQWGWNGAPALG